MSHRIWMLGCLFGFGFVAPVHAALLVYDGFETVSSNPTGAQYDSTYVPSPASSGTGSLYEQAPTTTGFAAAAWNGGGIAGGTNTVRPIRAQLPGLTYAGLTTVAGSVYMTRTTSATGSDSRVVRTTSYSGNPIADVGVDRWASFLVQPDLNDYAGSATSPFSLRLTFGGDLTFLVADNLELRGTATSGQSNVVLGTLAEDTTHLVLAKIRHNQGAFDTNSETITVWINPDLSLGEAGLGAGTSFTGVVLNSDLGSVALRELGEVRLNATMAATGSPVSSAQALTFDELRVGTTFGAVAAVPEPSSVALAGLGVLVAGGAWLRRRRARLHRA